MVSVDAFGAIGDSATDDTAAFAAAIATGQPIQLSDRTYAISGVAIDRSLGCRGIYGVAGSCIVPTGNGQVLFDVSGSVYSPGLSPFVLDGIAVDGNGKSGICAYRENDPYGTRLTNLSIRNVEYAGVFNRGRGVTISNIDQWGTGTWNFSGSNPTDRIFEVNISNINHQSDGGENWLHPWFAMYRAIGVQMTNVITASLDGTADGVSIEGACEGVFITNCIIVWPKTGFRLSTPGEPKPGYIYLTNCAADQATESGFDILGEVVRLQSANATFGSYRNNSGAGVIVRTGSADIDMNSVRISNMNKNGLEIQNGVTDVRGRGFWSKNNHAASGYDVEIYGNTTSKVWFDGKQVWGTKHATGQTL